MKSIVPHLWYNKEAREAAEFYITLFDNSRILHTAILYDTPSGDAETVDFELAGQPFESISGGPLFSLNPSISLMVHCETPAEVDRLWNTLIEGGTAMMPLDAYPFSPRYGWLADRYGLNWQLMFSPNANTTPKIVPCFLFSGAANGKAEEAVRYYAQVFANANIGLINHYAPGEATAAAAKANYISFDLLGVPFVAMDNGHEADFDFNEAFSLIISCNTQAEIDYYWEKLSHVPEAEACGWVKDQFGVSWQIVPRVLEELMNAASEEQRAGMTQAFLQMKKLDIETLTAAFSV